MEKTPDQIRRETVPVTHRGLWYGLLGTFVGTVFWFGGWGLFHQEQARRYPDYFWSALDTTTEGVTLFGAPKRHAAVSSAKLRYDLLRFGNADHAFDAEILRHGWYPKGTAKPAAWVYAHGGIAPLYAGASAIHVFDWPLTLSLLTCFGSAMFGFMSDHRYHMRLVAGIPFDGSIIATVDAYNKEVKGDGMRYAVKPWSGR